MRGFPINQDVLSGLMFAGWGAAGLWIGRDYPMGSVLRMGPGYVPWLLCWGLVVIGGAIAIRGLVRGAEKLERLYLRPFVLVPLALVAFTFLIGSAGLLLAAMGLVLLGALAGEEFRLHKALMLAVTLAVAAVALFVYGLKLPMSIWPV
jgi:hypothetical protein